ncbi:DUF6622 family protein [Variovorax soli]|uniref:DUF6622 family protein n=1 Tax=Variovorax soli TaxID=376815 RepID=UPI000838B040|nr:DUF6622 family protein [Variovorax soli]
MLLIQILQHTPTWVFGLFAGLLALGGRQMFATQAGLPRLAVMPLAMAGLSAYGVVSAFGSAPADVAAWALAAAAALALVLRSPLPQGVRFDKGEMRFTLPGTPVPLLLTMGIFFTKYAVGVLLAMHPEMARQAGFALAMSALYGAFAGLFLGRSLRLWKLALRAAPVSQMAASPAK